jgi:hypothetical protein
MKTKFPLLVMAMAWAGAGLFLWAQTDATDEDKKITPPALPWPARTPEMASWTITSDLNGTLAEPSDGSPNGQAGQDGQNSAPGGGHTPKAAPQMKIAVVKTWPIVHQVSTDRDGQTWDQWYENGTMLTHTPNSSALISMSGGGNSFYSQDYANADFSGFDWLSKKNFRGKTHCQGRDCYYWSNLFRPTRTGGMDLLDANAPPPASSSGGVYSARAYLDAKTLLPVMLQKGPEVRIYQFGTPPTVTQELPADFAKQLEQQALFKKQMSAPMARPF